MAKRRRHYSIGTVITGTLRDEDLLPAFMTELDWQRPLTKDERARLRDIERRMYRRNPNSTRGVLNKVDGKQSRPGYFGSDECNRDREWLEDALTRKAGPFMYFGAHPGNTSDFGFWLSEDWEDRLREQDGAVASDLAEYLERDPEFEGFIAVVNDHGNVTLFRRWWTGRFHKCVIEWEVV